MDRAKRVRRLKKIIIAVFLAAVIIPIVLCILLFIRMAALEEKLDSLLVRRQETTAVKEEVLQVSLMASRSVQAVSASRTVLAEEPEAVPQAETGQEAAHKIYLTFDDGPSRYTEEILDILKEYDIKATFFVVGREDGQSLAMYRRIVAEGHTLGMHSYSHQYREIYASKEAFAADMTRLSDLLYRTTGVRPNICRFPGGSSNRVSSVDMQELFAWLAEEEIEYYDWNISSGDAASHRLSVQTIVHNATDKLEGYKSAMILMHDAADKHTTAEALPLIIEKGLEMEDTAFLPITQDTAKIQHKQ